jgi:hypothetical protein
MISTTLEMIKIQKTNQVSMSYPEQPARKGCSFRSLHEFLRFITPLRTVRYLLHHALCNTQHSRANHVPPNYCTPSVAAEKSDGLCVRYQTNVVFLEFSDTYGTASLPKQYNNELVAILQVALIRLSPLILAECSSHTAFCYTS